MSRDDVESGERAWLAAFNGGDAAAVAALYADGARLMPPNTDMLSGRAAIEEFIKTFIAIGAKLEMELVDVHDGGDICSSIGKYRMTAPAGPPGTLPC